LALVTIAPGAERVVMPSKTYSALVAGQAILAICPRKSDLADLVFRHDCGWVVEPGDVAGLTRTLAWMAEKPDELWAKRRNSFEAGHRHYDTGVLAETWMNFFEEMRPREFRNEPAAVSR
jgi:colanic acid biosynthesis glycosyl transferase WcaI